MIIVSGVGGLSIYLNDLRVAGPKPWGGGEIIKEFKVDPKDVREALKRGG